MRATGIQTQIYRSVYRQTPLQRSCDFIRQIGYRSMVNIHVIVLEQSHAHLDEYARNNCIHTLINMHVIVPEQSRAHLDESPRHLFVQCPKYQEWRNESLQEVLTRTDLKLDNFEVVGETRENLIAAAKLLFTDSVIWPLHFSLYFLGQLPNINELFTGNSDITFIQRRRLISHLSADWHTSSIRLAGRIFGDFQKRMAVLNDTTLYYKHF
jgi:hypothetical protein